MDSLQISVRESDLPFNQLTRWAELLTPLLEKIDQHSRQAARDEYAKLRSEHEANAAEEQRNEALLSVKQAAEILGVTSQTAWEWQKRGLLPSHRIGRRIFFRRGEVIAALQTQTQVDGKRKYARRPARVANPKGAHHV